MKQYFIAPVAGHELSLWIRHIEGWTDPQIQGYIRTLRAQIARTSTPQARVFNEFVLDRLLDLQERRKADQTTLGASGLTTEIGSRAGNFCKSVVLQGLKTVRDFIVGALSNAVGTALATNTWQPLLGQLHGLLNHLIRR